MIKVPFLHYKTLQGFKVDLTKYGTESLADKIVFIDDENLIWTHNNYYGASASQIAELKRKIDDIGSFSIGDYDLNEILATFNLVKDELVEHIVIEQSDYEALTEYKKDAIYFILEPQDNVKWTFGDKLPIILI